MHQTRHLIQVTLHDDRSAEPINGGTLQVEGEPYELSEDRALELVMASEHLDLAAAEGRFVRWRGHLIPADHFTRLEAAVVSASRLDPESIAQPSE